MQDGGIAEQRRAELAPHDLGHGGVEQQRERPVGTADPARVVHHRDPLAQGVERGLPLLLGAPHQIEEPRVGERDRRVGRDGREQAYVFRRERPGARVRHNERADDDAVRPERHRGGGGDLNAVPEGRRRAIRPEGELQPLPPERARQQPGVGDGDSAPAQLGEGAIGACDDDRSRVARDVACQGHESAAGVDTAVALTVSGLRRRLGRTGALRPDEQRSWLAALELALPSAAGRDAVRRLQRLITQPGGPERALAAAQAAEDVWEELRPPTPRAAS